MTGDPEGQEDEPEDVKEEPAEPFCGEGRQQRGQSEGRGGACQGHYHEIGDNADQRELVEVAQHDRRDGELVARAYRDGRGEPLRPAARLKERHRGRGEPEDAQGGNEGELEAGFPEIPWAPEQGPQRCEPGC